MFHATVNVGSSIVTINIAVIQKTFLQTSVPIEDSDQHAHSHSLIRIFIGRILDCQGHNCFFMRTKKIRIKLR